MEPGTSKNRCLFFAAKTALLLCVSVGPSLQAATVTEILCRLDHVEQILTKPDLKAKDLQISPNTAKIWKRYDDLARRVARRNIRKNYKDYAKAYAAGHPHVRFMVEEWGVKLGKSRDDVEVPSVAAFLQAYYRHMAAKVAEGKIEEKDVPQPVRVFFREFDVVDNGEVGKKSSLPLNSIDFAKAPELVDRLLRDGKIRNRSDNVSVYGDSVVPRSFVFIKYGEEVPEDLIPWPGVMGDHEYAKLVSEGFFPIGEPNDHLRNGENISPLEHDLGHFTGFLEEDGAGRLTYLKNFRGLASQWLALSKHSSENTKERNFWAFLYASEYVVDVRKVPEELLREIFPLLGDKRFLEFKEDEWRIFATSFMDALSDVQVKKVYEGIEKHLWKLLLPYGGGARDLFSTGEGQANLMLIWNSARQNLKERDFQNLRVDLGRFQVAYLLHARSGVSIAGELGDFFSLRLRKNKRLLDLLCKKERGAYEDTGFCP